MSEMTDIILRLLWRFYPIAWLTTIIVRALSRIASWLEDEESLVELAHDPEECAWIGGWLSLAEDRLNELIVMKAMRLLGRCSWLPPRPKGQFAGHRPARAVRTPKEILARLSRLIALYHDHQRLYEQRARKLARLLSQAELQLEVIHHPIQAQPASARGAGSVGIAGMIGAIGIVGMIGVSVAKAARHPSLSIRGPPCLGFSTPNPGLPNSQTASLPRRSAAKAGARARAHA